jgi:hypothetical protein
MSPLHIWRRAADEIPPADRSAVRSTAGTPHCSRLLAGIALLFWLPQPRYAPGPAPRALPVRPRAVARCSPQPGRFSPAHRPPTGRGARQTKSQKCASAAVRRVAKSSRRRRLPRLGGSPNSGTALPPCRCRREITDGAAIPASKATASSVTPERGTGSAGQLARRGHAKSCCLVRLWLSPASAGRSLRAPPFRPSAGRSRHAPKQALTHGLRRASVPSHAHAMSR